MPPPATKTTPLSPVTTVYNINHNNNKNNCIIINNSNNNNNPPATTTCRSTKHEPGGHDNDSVLRHCARLIANGAGKPSDQDQVPAFEGKVTFQVDD